MRELADTVTYLEAELNRGRDARGVQVSRLRLYLRLAFALFIVVIATAVLWSYKVPPKVDFLWPLITFVFAGAALFLLALAAQKQSTIRYIDEGIQDLQFEMDLNRFKVSDGETRAEKMLRINRAQLRRYYDLNLNQNIWVFGLGVSCILLGVAVIAGTLKIVLNVPDSVQAITAVLGGVTALLVNFVAAIYLAMHARTIAQLGDFHSRLVMTHRLFLANLLVSRIDDSEKRWIALSRLAISMSESGEWEKAGPNALSESEG